MEAKLPHFVLFPYLAQGHMIPMLDLGRLLARRGVVVTILLTSLNYRRVQPVIDRAIASGLNIRVSVMKFPCTEVGLPEGCENFDMLPSFADALKLHNGTVMLRDEVEELLKVIEPSCLISDFCLSWTMDLALELGIPRIVFHGMSCFAQLLWHVVGDVEAMASSDTEYVPVPGLPDRIEITKVQLRGTSKPIPPDWEKVRQEVREADKKAFGIVANTFEELESEYIKRCMEVHKTRIWCVGPVSLFNQDGLDKVERGNKSSIDGDRCLKWLDERKPGSVVYVCLGSISRINSQQLIELGLGLEASGRPFIWVVRDASDELKAWLKEENFESRIGGRPGMLIHGWAPQVLILSHPAVGGFVTHCGWNSTLEGIAAGLPMVTWPVFAEQFCNEKFVVNVIRTGVRAGVEMPVMLGEEEETGVQVRSEEIRVAIDETMEGGDDGEERRERARKLGQMAKGAFQDETGSSSLNLTRLIQDVQQIKMSKQ